LNITLNNSHTVHPMNEIPSKESIHNSMGKIKKYYLGSSTGPSLFQCFFFPYQLYHGYKALNLANKTENKEAILDTKLNLFNICINSIYSLSSVLVILSQLQILFSYATATISTIAPITGIIACTMTTAIGIRNFRRQYNFRLNCIKSLDQLKIGIVDRDSLHFLLKYIGTSSKIDSSKLSILATRVKPWFAEQVALELPTLLKNIEHSLDPKLKKESIEKIFQLISDAKIQSEKKMIQQSLILIANIILIAAFSSVIAMQPQVILLELFALSMSAIALKYIFSSGSNHRGWKFVPQDCIPIKKLKEVFLKSP